MKVFFLLFAVTIATASLDNVRFEWEMFKVEHGKTYSSDKEHAKRFHIFRKNYHYIKQHNRLYNAGESSFALGINEFADMTNEEFAAQFNGFSAAEMVRDPANEYEVNDVAELPKAVDWRKKGYVTPVKNQGQCGSCWAFSAVGSTEGAHFKKTGKLVSLSEQNLVDCEKQDLGCNGGLMDHAFQYVIKNKGIDTETSYPYKAKDEKCEFKTADVGATISSYQDIAKGSEHALTVAIAKEGPVSVAIDASHPSFQLYLKGIYNEPSCSSTQLDHGVLAVGYGSYNNTDYYIVKNSWGVSWGQQGYIWMSRNKKNQCGIASAASFPIA